MLACLGKMEACVENMEAMTKAGQEEMRPEIKIGLEEMKANQEKREHIKATNVLTALQAQASDVLHEVPK
jgi:hypothetical protein